MPILLLAEHDNAAIKPATLNAVTAAGKIGGEIHLLVAGHNAKAAADAVRVTYDKQTPNVDTELKADDEPEVVDTTFAKANRMQSKRGDAEGAFAAAPVRTPPSSAASRGWPSRR